MKKGSLLILLLILSLVSASASVVETRMASDGSIRFDGKSNRLFYNPVVPLSNGNLLVAVNSSPTGGAYQTWAVCIAPDGEMLWATEISRDGESMFVSSMREMSDGTIHITASLHRYKDRQQMGLAIQNGSILWQIALPCTIANLVGSYLGTGIAVKRGPGLVRYVAIIVVLLYVGKTFLETIL